MTPLVMAETLLKAGNAAAAYKFLMEIPKASVERDFLVAKCCAKLGDVPAAMVAYTSVLSRDPQHTAAASALGALYLNKGWLDKAEALYTKTLKKKDDDKLRVELGVLYWMRGQQQRALAEVERVLGRNPRHYAARLQHAIMELTLSRYSEAAADLEMLREEGKEDPLFLSSLGTLEFRKGRYEEAAIILSEACRRNAADSISLTNLAISQALIGELEESRASLRRLREVDPARWQTLMANTKLGRTEGQDDEFDPRPIFLLFAYQEQLTCNWMHRRAYEEVFRELIANPRNTNPGLLAHCSGIAPLSIDERRQLMAHAGRSAAAGCIPWRHEPSPTPPKLRVGYVMSHLGDHVVANIMLRLIASHNSDNVEVHLFSTTQQENDYGSGKAEQYLAIPGVAWTDLTPLGDADAAACIHAAGLDVLVDLAVYNDHSRPSIVARRPAPVQVSFLGAPFTSGADWMDYIITDAVVSPSQQGWCTEAEVRMPACYFVYGHEDTEPPSVPPRSVFGLPENRFLYSGLNNPYKIDPDTFEVWLRILKGTPESLLLLKAGNEIQKNLRARAELSGVNPDRLLFVPRVSDRDYLLRQGSPDLFLDTRYYGAHTTMAESLWMGVPALTCPGEAFQSRVGASLLTSCGLQELIASDWDAYEALAISLYHDRSRLQVLRDRLARSRLKAAPFDMPAQAKALEKAFRHMRDRFAEGLSPASFKVDELPE